MKKILFVLNPVYPKRDHNSNLMLRLVRHMNADAELLSLNVNVDKTHAPKKLMVSHHTMQRVMVL